jgi:tetratricopeptide (TPR) repeat protein
VNLKVFLGVALALSGATSFAHANEPQESLRTQLQQCFRVQYVLRDHQDTTLVQVMIQVDAPPADMAFDMALRAGDDSWPLGPVAWVKDEIGWWAYDTDLPEEIRQVAVVLTPSAAAAAKSRRDNPHRLAGLSEVWTGSPIVLGAIAVRSQEISMCRIGPPGAEAARDYAMEQFDLTDRVVQQLKSDGDWPKARAQLERRAIEQPDDAVAVYNWGCMALAENDLSGALKTFIDVRQLNPPAPLARQIQRQLRRICARYLDCAEKGDTAAMCALGTAYENGWGASRIFQQAKRWYRKAGNAGNPEAMCRLAAMYEHETGATIHTDQAHEWYRRQTLEWYGKAASLGNEEARQWLSTHDPH